MYKFYLKTTSTKVLLKNSQNVTNLAKSLEMGSFKYWDPFLKQDTLMYWYINILVYWYVDMSIYKKQDILISYNQAKSQLHWNK